MRKFITILITILFLSAQGSAIAEPPPPGSDFVSRLRVEFCDHSSEIPHLSEHVPGTMNVSGRTVCRGNSKMWKVSVRVTVVRHDGGNTPKITKSASGNGKAIANVSMPCIWSRKQSKILYTITTVHTVPGGHTYYTENEERLEC